MLNRLLYGQRCFSVCTKCGGSCLNGNLVPEELRTGENQCASCHANHHLAPPHADGQGNPGTHTCTACAPGYFAPADNTAEACNPYGGACGNGGELIAQEMRTQHDHCGSCNQGNGFCLDGDNRCSVCAGTCTNGVLIAEGKRRHANHCGSCNAGHYLEAEDVDDREQGAGGSSTCVAYAGTCDHGGLVKAEARTQHGQAITNHKSQIKMAQYVDSSCVLLSTVSIPTLMDVGS